MHCCVRGKSPLGELRSLVLSYPSGIPGPQKYVKAVILGLGRLFYILWGLGMGISSQKCAGKPQESSEHHETPLGPMGAGRGVLEFGAYLVYWHLRSLAGSSQDLHLGGYEKLHEVQVINPP